MVVSKIMTRNPVFIRPDTSLSEARSVMDTEHIGHLPVLNRNNALVGLITKKDLLKAGPSPATSLDMYEISYLLSKLTVEEIMEKNVVTVAMNEVIEEAARIMADRGIGCLPVMHDSLLVGIITDTDIFHFFVNAFGARHKGIRITLSFDEKPGQLAMITTAIAERGGNLVAFVSAEGDDLSRRRATLKITGISRAAVEEAVSALDNVEIEDLRE